KAIEKAKEIFKIEKPTEEQINAAEKKLIDEACEPFDKPEFRNLLIEIKKKNEQIIDTISKDRIIFAGFDEQAKERARGVVETFKKFIEENKNELTALQMIYNQPYGRRHITYKEIKQLAEAIQKPPYNLTTELLWQAYEQLEQSRVKKAGPQRLLTDIISLLRFALGEESELVPFAEIVNERFEKWIKQQEQQSKKFTPEQMKWLTKIKDHIASSLAIEKDDFELSPFYEEGGLIKAYQIFRNELDEILEELNQVLAA
ncbi:MAG: restriction endonuclease subunit R, partial [Nitrospirae bacterium]|nr:restriction endonuclease subunit R [Nitrospirota bacterium]